MKHQNYEFLIAVANGDDLGEWEYSLEHLNRWISAKYSEHAAGDNRFKFRRKQKTITINGIEVPEPLRVAPKDGEAYWVAGASYNCAQQREWDSDPIDKRLLAYGVIHSTKEAAEQHRRALILACGGDPDYKD